MNVFFQGLTRNPSFTRMQTVSTPSLGSTLEENPSCSASLGRTGTISCHFSTAGGRYSTRGALVTMAGKEHTLDLFLGTGLANCRPVCRRLSYRRKPSGFMAGSRLVAAKTSSLFTAFRMSFALYL